MSTLLSFFPALAVPPWALPIVAAWRALVDWLRGISVTVNGLAIATLVVGALGGAWWISHRAVANEREEQARLKREATAELVRDLEVIIQHRQGRITDAHDRIGRISAELKALVANIPPEVQTKREVDVVPISVPLPVPVPGKTRTITVTGPGCDYTPEILGALNRIQIAPGLGGSK